MLLPQYILDIFAIYEANGYEAFVVGGCVRDAICKRNCHDYDAVSYTHLAMTTPPYLIIFIVARAFKKGNAFHTADNSFFNSLISFSTGVAHASSFEICSCPLAIKIQRHPA